MIEDKHDVRGRYASAVEAYRRSVDLYRQVVELRTRNRRGQSMPLLRVPDEPAPEAERLPVGPEPPRLELLTTREREVACLIARGWTNAQIAEALVVTRGTVANHVAHILNKLGLSNRTQLAAFVTRAQASGAQQQAAG